MFESSHLNIPLNTFQPNLISNDRKSIEKVYYDQGCLINFFRCAIYHANQVKTEESKAFLDFKLPRFTFIELRNMIRTNGNDFLKPNNEGNSPFKSMILDYPSTSILPLLEDVLDNLEGEQIDHSSLKVFKNYLFEQKSGQQPPFELLMGLNNANQLFDKLLPYIEMDELNENPSMRLQVFNFAFSSKRYESIFLQQGNLSEISLVNAASAFNAHRIPNLMEKIEAMKKRGSADGWNWKRMESSTTLNSDERDKNVFINNWKNANSFTLNLAKAHQEKGRSLDSDDIY